MSVDYIIVGAGPAGITIAYLLASAGKTCILIDQNNSIGGCHRVKRVNGMFTEHSPRVYLNSYLNTKKLLVKMGSSFSSLFTPYHFSIGFTSSELVKHLSFSENLLLANEFIHLIYSPFYDQKISVQTFTERHGFSASSIDYLDRLCRFSDGGGMNRYSMYQLLQLINQNIFYSIYQPTLPNDVGLFPIMQNALVQTGKVTLSLNQTVVSILYQDGKATGVVTSSGNVMGNNIVLAVPPPALYSIVNASPSPVPSAFGDLGCWVEQSSYNIDIGATFHWDTSLNLPKKWGFPSSEWGLISIPITDYMDMNEPRSKTVISTCITYLDRSSSVLGLTANQVSDPNQLVAEMFRQLKETYPDLPSPTTSILSPTVYRSNNQWVEQDSGFFKSAKTKYLSSEGKIPNLFQVGTQNGNSSFHFTTFEAAVTNAIAFVTKREPSVSMHISSPVELVVVIRWILLVILLIIIGFILIRYMLKIRRGRLSQ